LLRRVRPTISDFSDEDEDRGFTRELSERDGFDISEYFLDRRGSIAFDFTSDRCFALKNPRVEKPGIITFDTSQF